MVHDSWTTTTEQGGEGTIAVPYHCQGGVPQLVAHLALTGETLEDRMLVSIVARLRP